MNTIHPGSMAFTLLRRVGRVRMPSFRSFYIQGQTSEVDGEREYFYYIDHQGMLFLDDARMKNFTSCYKEKKFLSFFFRRLKKNNKGKYADKGFDFISPCGPEMNYVRCEDTPIVFTNLIREEDRLIFNHGDSKLSVDFSPYDVYMVPSTGRVYHPTNKDSKFGSAGLISDKLSIAWTEEERFKFDYGPERPPTKFRWKGKEHKLSKNLADKLVK